MCNTTITARIQEQNRFESLRHSIMRNGASMYIGFLLQQAAQRLGDHTALLYDTRTVSYNQLYYAAARISKQLIKQGIMPKDRVLILMENSPEFYAAYFGVLQVGAVVVPLNVFLKERELAHIVQDAQPSLIITTTHFIPLFNNAAVALPTLWTEEHIPPLESAQPDSIDVIALAPDDMAALLYTSGTTGLPKGVMLSSTNIMINIVQGISKFDLTPHDRILGVLPLFHSFAQNTCVWAPLFIGCTVILVPKIERRSIVKALEKQPTIFLGVPALYGLMCLLKTAPISTVRYFISGADALPDKIRAGFELLYRRKISSGYGMTETSPFVSGSMEEETVPTYSVGYPLMAITSKITDEHGNELPQGSIGLLWLKGPNVMLGYYNAPELTAQVLQDGWLNTGDLGYKDAKGRLVITGRLKDLIIHKGFNIYPSEIENIIMSHPLVIRVGVIGKKEEESGEIPIAYVQIKEEKQGIEEELRALCVKNLALYKIPREFICRTTDLPMTSTGKVDKKKLRD